MSGVLRQVTLWRCITIMGLSVIEVFHIATAVFKLLVFSRKEI